MAPDDHPGATAPDPEWRRHLAGWWQTPLWRYAVFAVVVYSRAAAERLAVPVGEVARQVAARHGLELTS